MRGLSRVSARLRSLGVQKGQRGPRRRPSSGWESLTSTEAAVVELVTDGLTTREIAQRLFVSPRTVECHLSHIFRKLGLASRTALRTEARRRAGAEQAYAGRDTAMSATRPT